jgi:alkylhydroperoxidase family enzyme
MAWIRTIPEEQAGGRLAEIYSEIRKGFPVVPNVMKALSLRPELLGHLRQVAMSANVRDFRRLAPDPHAGRDDRDGRVIDKPVPLLNQRPCGGPPHAIAGQRPRGAAQRRLAKREAQRRRRAMLAYAEKLTVNPSAMTKKDLDGLREHFSEDQAFDIVIIACLFNFMDRIADAFGVELDPILSQLARLSPEGEALAEVAASTRS